MHFRLHVKKSETRRQRELSLPLLHVSNSLEFGARNSHVIDRVTFSLWREQIFKLCMRYILRCPAFSWCLKTLRSIPSNQWASVLLRRLGLLTEATTHQSRTPNPLAQAGNTPDRHHVIIMPIPSQYLVQENFVAKFGSVAQFHCISVDLTRHRKSPRSSQSKTPLLFVC